MLYIHSIMIKMMWPVQANESRYLGVNVREIWTHFSQGDYQGFQRHMHIYLLPAKA